MRAADRVRTVEHHFATVLGTYDELLEEKRALQGLSSDAR
jgi:hypothetical protein